MNQRLDPAGDTRIRAVSDTLGLPPQPPREAPANFLHCAIQLGQGRQLGSETFRLVRFSGQDTASELFDYQLELHANTSYRNGQSSRLEFEDLIGRALTVVVQRPSQYDNTAMVERFQLALGGGEYPELVLYNGIIAAFAMEERGVYRISMKPAMHRMTLTNQYQVYPSQSPLDVVQGLLKKHRINANLAALGDSENPFANRRQHWLQAGESDFDFMRRLMGKAHVYFYFSHDGRSHTVWFANRPAYRPAMADGRRLRYTSSAADELGLHQDDVIFQYNYQCAMTSSSIRGVFARQINGWEEDDIPRLHAYAASTSTDPGDLPFTQYKIYQYGGSTDEVDQHIDVTDNTMQAAAQVFSGASYCAQFRSGHQFTVTGQTDSGDGPVPVRPALDGQRFVLTQVKFEAGADGSYQNQFQSCPASGVIAAFSMQETQQGSVLGEVVPPPGAVPGDWRYYPADTFGLETIPLQSPEEQVRALAVYVRLSTDAPNAPPALIKLAPHMQTMPEPGVTVLVARAQDESELPEIQSIIHNNGTKVVMPSGWTASSHVGSGYNTSYGDGKSIRFGLKSEPALAFAVDRVTQAYQEGCYKEASYSQGASYSYSCAESAAASPSDRSELYGKYAGAADLLSASESFGSNYSRHHGAVVSSYANIGTSYNESVTGISESVSTVNGSSSSSATHFGDVSSTSTVHANSTNIQTVTGINAAVTTHAISLSNSNTGLLASLNTVGVTTSKNYTGAASHSNTTLLSSNSNTTGISSDTGATVAHSSISVTGASNVISLTGASVSVDIKGIGSAYQETLLQVGAELRDIDVVTIAVLRVYL